MIRSYAKGVVRRGENIMSSNDKKNKGGREDRKKAKLNPKEKRKLKNEKKKKFNPFGTAYFLGVAESFSLLPFEIKLCRAKWIELLFLFVFQFSLFFWIQLGFFTVFTTTLVFLVITTHNVFSSSNNPFGVNCESNKRNNFSIHEYSTFA